VTVKARRIMEMPASGLARCAPAKMADIASKPKASFKLGAMRNLRLKEENQVITTIILI
jgi:hypothetical protein